MAVQAGQVHGRYQEHRSGKEGRPPAQAKAAAQKIGEVAGKKEPHEHGAVVGSFWAERPEWEGEQADDGSQATSEEVNSGRKGPL